MKDPDSAFDIKCYTIPVEEAVARGFYGGVEIGPETLVKLKTIFPDGVCDYSKGDAGRPRDLRPGWHPKHGKNVSPWPFHKSFHKRLQQRRFSRID